LRVAIGISGWLSSSPDVYKPWEVIDAETTEPFALRFELDAMLRLGNSLQDVLFSYAWDGLTYTVMSRTMLGALYAGLWPLGLIKLASVLDNPFSVALARADKAGKVLAHALIDGVQGKRPVTLMGYSVGARVIYACLLELAEQHAFGLVESVVLMGAPAPSDDYQWRMIRSVVAARVVNVYSTEDYVLGYLYRSTKLEFGVAGLDAVKGVHGIENVDMSKFVSGHDKYRYLAGKILVKIGFGDVNFNKVAEQERALELAERKKQRMKEQAKENESRSQSTGIPAREAAKPKSPNLIDVSEDQQRSRMSSASKASRPRPAVYTQNRSRQQPIRQTSMVVESSTSGNHRPLPVTAASDPLGATTLIDMSAPEVKQPSRPMASAMNQRQMPSALLSDPAAKEQPLRIPPPIKYDISGPITLMDRTECEPAIKTDKDVFKTASLPLRKADSNVLTTASLPSRTADKDVLKTGSAVTVTEVAVSDEDKAAVAESDIDLCDDDSSESGSEFGELTMVDPVPMDDFDYGLM
jgi:hypothetical protein